MYLQKWCLLSYTNETSLVCKAFEWFILAVVTFASSDVISIMNHDLSPCQKILSIENTIEILKKRKNILRGKNINNIEN